MIDLSHAVCLYFTVHLQVSEECSPVVESLIRDPLAELLGVVDGDVNRPDGGGRTLLHSLSAEGNARLLELAIATCRDADLEVTDRHGQTPLNLAARHGHGDVVAVLLAAGATPDHADCDGWTALRAAAWGGHTQVREFSSSYVLHTFMLNADKNIL
jgi:ankyrin repeat protein